MANHSFSCLRVPWAEEPCRLRGVARIGQDLVTKPTNQGNSAFQKVVSPQRLFIHHFCLIVQIFCDVINLSLLLYILRYSVEK